MRKIFHIITGLGDGGAEATLFRLINLARASDKHIVLSLTGPGKYGALIEELDLTTFYLDLKGTPRDLSKLIGLVRLLRLEKPDVIQTWMYHADLVGGLAGRAAGIKNIIWNIRHSEVDQSGIKTRTRVVVKVCALLSKLIPRKIVVCAQKAKSVHANYGYPKDKMVVIPNGYVVPTVFEDKTIVDQDKKLEKWRTEITPLLGMVARYNPQKDHVTLLMALKILVARGVDFNCELVGEGVDVSNTVLVSKIRELGLDRHVTLVGQLSNVPQFMQRIDIHVLSSAYGEGFPNVVAEAMMQGTPCVSTDVGDAALILGDLGWIVEPSSPLQLTKALALAIEELISDERAWFRRREACHSRIKRNFTLEHMVQRYESIWSDSVDSIT